MDRVEEDVCFKFKDNVSGAFIQDGLGGICDPNDTELRGRKLTSDSHESLVNALRELVDKGNSARTGEGEVEVEPEWEFNNVIAEWLSKDHRYKLWLVQW